MTHVLVLVNSNLYTKSEVCSISHSKDKIGPQNLTSAQQWPHSVPSGIFIHPAIWPQ